MSGIAGIIAFGGAPADPRLVARMTDAMAHRGPDGIGEWHGPGAALGQCMLRTTPESLGETQPLTSVDGNRVLVMDGRLDNWTELRATLVALGLRPRDRSDAELVLCAYERWGPDCVHHLAGDFAFVLWDAARRRACCARDQLGSRPFFYHWDGRRFAFASEPGALLELPWVPRELNEGMVAEIVANRRLSREETPWSGVLRLPAARRMIVAGDGLRVDEYWRPDLAAEIRYRRDAEYAEHHRSILEDVVRRQSRTHRPLGCEVSGGIDSSAVLAVGEHLRRAGRLLAPGIEALTLRFEAGSPADEIAHARAVGQHLHCPIHEADPFLPPLGWFEDWARRHRDFPPFPNAAMGLGLMREAAARGVRSVLTGQGGDDWQTGTRLYYADFVQDLALRELARALARDRAAFGTALALRWLLRHGLMPFLPGAGEGLVRLVRDWRGAGGADPAGLLRPELRALLAARARAATLVGARAPRPRHIEALETLRSPLRAYFREVSEMLAASVGIEKRDPLHSLPVVEFHFATAEHTRLRGAQSRVTHRMAVADLLPPEVIGRQDKAQFAQVVTRHLDAFGAGGSHPLAQEALKWIDTPELERHLARAAGSHQENWRLWSIWGLFGCAMVARASIISPNKGDPRA